MKTLLNVKLFHVLYCLVFFLCTTTCLQAEPLISDRPDFTESSATLEPNHWQLEGGYTLEKQNDIESHSLGEILWRYGLCPKSELRLGLNSHRWLHEPQQRTSGIEDANLGVKIKLHEKNTSAIFHPNLSVIVATSLPTGSSEYREHHLQPEIKFIAGWELSEKFSFSSNLNYASIREDHENWNQFSYSLSLGYALQENWGSYLEFFSFVPEEQNGGNADFINGGLTYLVNDDLQFDVRTGFGLNGNEPDYFVGMGFVVKH